MGDDNTTGLIDVSDMDLDDLRQLQNPAIFRALQQVTDTSGTVAGFQSVI
ncbi:hypothetical protein OHA25_58580 [Nonomuraea sp. NBC_00507]